MRHRGGEIRFPRVTPGSPRAAERWLYGGALATERRKRRRRGFYELRQSVVGERHEPQGISMGSFA